MKTALTTLLSIWLLVGCGKKEATNPVIEKAAQMAVKEMTEDEKRFEEMKTFAKKGIAEAQFNLSLMYHKGDGVQKDDKEATKWIRKAADQGHVTAQFNLGVSYLRGKGVLEDHALAYAWWSIAGANGNADAKKKQRRRRQKNDPRPNRRRSETFQRNDQKESEAD